MQFWMSFRLSPKKISWNDSPQSRLLSMFVEHTCITLAHSSNTWIVQGVFLACHKTSLIISVPNKLEPDPRKLAASRVSACVKQDLEKTFFSGALPLCSVSSVILKNQYGFCKSYSCKTNLICAQKFLRKNSTVS